MSLVDYAHPCMMAEFALKRLHQAMLENRYDDAAAAGLEAIVQARLTITAIKEQKQKASQGRGTGVNHERKAK